MTDRNPQQLPDALEDFALRIGAMGGEAEGEIRSIIAYLNQKVVPGVRKRSMTALRRDGEQLTRLADDLKKRIQWLANPTS